MSIDWSRFKDEVIDLYRCQNLSMDDVREKMRENHGIYPSIRSYRQRVKEWGVLKRHQKQAETLEHPFSTVSVDSGYGPSPYHSWTTPASLHSLRSLRSSGWSESGMHPIPLEPPSRLSEPLPPLTAGAPPTDQTQSSLDVRPPGSSGISTGAGIQLPDNAQTVGSLSSHSTRSLSAHLQPHAPPPVPAAPRKLAYHRHGGYADCGFCCFREPHYVATFANGMTIGRLEERVRELGDINKRDIFGNTGLHHLAARGPDLDQLEIFFRAGADMNCRNTDGETFMHHLDLSRLAGGMGNLLGILVSSGFDLTQRAHNSQTILHSFFERKFSLDVLCEILPAFQSAGNDINARDNQGYSAVDKLYANWKVMLGTGERSSDDVEHLKQIFIYFGASWRLRRGSGIGLVEDDDGESWLTSPQRLDEDHDGRPCRSAQSLEVQDREMLDVIRESLHEPLSRNSLGRNSLHCLAHVIRLNPESPMSPQAITARLDRVAECIAVGVDLNGFDCFGETPLHSFLSKPRSNEDETTTASIVRLLASKGADIDMRNRDGEVPLHLACKRGLRECVGSLLQLGANVHARNRGGRGVIAEARIWMTLVCGEDTERGVAHIAQTERCIEMVQHSGGVENPTELQEYSWRGG